MIFAPYPGSPDFNKLMASGKVEITDDYYYLALTRSGRSSRTYNPRMRTGELILWQFGMLLAFYTVAYLTRPWRFLDLVHSLLTAREETLLDQVVRIKLRQFWTKLRLSVRQEERLSPST